MVDRFAINIDGCHITGWPPGIFPAVMAPHQPHSRDPLHRLERILFKFFLNTFGNGMSSQIRETVSASASQQSRARSIAPMSSMSSSSEQDSLMRYYSGYLDTGARARARASQPRELGTQESAINKVRERDLIMGIMQLQKKSVVENIVC